MVSNKEMEKMHNVVNKKKESIKCSECGAENPDDSIFCGFCGNKLCITNKNELNKDQEIKFCRKCGKEIFPGSNFCALCGERLNNEEEFSSEKHGIFEVETSMGEKSLSEKYLSDGTPEPKNTESKYDSESNILNELDELTLTPAESMMILKKDVNGKELLKITMIDLIARQVISVEDVEVQKGRIIKKNAVFKIIKKGNNFETPLRIHEEIFRTTLSAESMNFSYYTKKLVKQFTSSWISTDFPNYRNRFIRDPLVEAGYLMKVKKKVAGIIPKESYQLTDYGLEVKLKLENLLNQGFNLQNWVMDDKERAKAYMEACGTYIFLLRDYDLKTLKNFTYTLSKVNLKEDIYKKYLLLTPAFVTYMGINVIKHGKGDLNISSMDFDWDSTGINFNSVGMNLDSMDLEMFNSFNSFDDLFEYVDTTDTGVDSNNDDGGGSGD